MTDIKQAAVDCRAAFAGIGVGAIVQHCHHKLWLERLTEPAENRVVFILRHKDKEQQAERLRRFRPLAYADREKVYADWQKAYADWQKAYADWKNAYADWQKADADREKAYADWQKAYADREKANADWKNAYADWQKADADWQKAYADREKADADWEKAYADWQNAAQSPAMLALHKEVCGCPWSDTTDIFGKPRN